MLEHLTTTQPQSYSNLVGALHCRFRHWQWPKVYYAQLKTRRWRKDEPQPLLVQDVELLVQGTYPMVACYQKDCFVDALCDCQLHVHVK